MTSAEAAREAYRGDNARDQDGLLDDQDMEMDPQQVESTLEAYAEVINLDNEGTHDNLQLIDWILQVSEKNIHNFFSLPDSESSRSNKIEIEYS